MSYRDEPPTPRHGRRGGSDDPRDRRRAVVRAPEPSNPLLRAAQESPPDYRSVLAVTRAGAPPGRRAARLALIAVAVVALLAGGGYAGYAGVHWFRSRPAGTTASGAPATAVKDEATTAPTPAGAKLPDGRKVARLGVAVRDGSFAFKVTEIRDAGTVLLGSGTGAVRAGGRFVLVDVTVKNLGGTARRLRPERQLLRDSAMNNYPPRTAIRLVTVRQLWTAIRPGAAVRGTLVFDVPENQKPSDLLLRGAATSPGLDLSIH